MRLIHETVQYITDFRSKEGTSGQNETTSSQSDKATHPLVVPVRGVRDQRVVAHHEEHGVDGSGGELPRAAVVCNNNTGKLRMRHAKLKRRSQWQRLALRPRARQTKDAR